MAVTVPFAKNFLMIYYSFALLSLSRRLFLYLNQDKVSALAHLGFKFFSPSKEAVSIKH